MAYGVATTNVFELLGDSEGADDATPVIKAPEPKKRDPPSKAAETATAEPAGEQACYARPFRDLWGSAKRCKPVQ